ncbi:MAG: GGDEF domain-containing protein, partial [Marinicella sp.]
YLNAHILFNQERYDEAKQSMNDFWWHRYNHVLKQQELHVEEIRNQFLTLVDEKTENFELANQRLMIFKWLIALLLLLISVIVYLIIRTKKDANQLAKQHNKLEQLNRIDYQTNLYNRRYFLTCLKDEFDENCNDDQAESCLLMVDIDHFKAINDNYGHASGDLALEKVANIITQQAHETTLCARYGGEEFILLLRDTSIAEAFKFAEALRIAIQSTAIIIENQVINVTSSIGLAACNNNKNYQDWIQNADMAMYQSKGNGRNKTTIFEELLSNSPSND